MLTIDMYFFICKINGEVQLDKMLKSPSSCNDLKITRLLDRLNRNWWSLSLHLHPR